MGCSTDVRAGNVEPEVVLSHRLKSLALIVHPDFMIKQREIEIEASKQKFLDLRKKPFLPAEIADTLFLYLNAEDLTNISSVSKKWYLLSLQDKYWTKLAKQQYSIDIKEFRNSSDGLRMPARSFYKEIESIWRRHTQRMERMRTAEMLTKQFNLPSQVALNLLSRYES
mmetsp:Transcript_3902/g.4504  ORF Transcript_3902/g.4504 Transcript_3902/m.4504 type:complete len:169 (+) Transcript_3902:1715-2221(+)